NGRSITRGPRGGRHEAERGVDVASWGRSILTTLRRMPHRKRSRPSFPAMGRLAPAPRGEPVPPRVAVIDEDAQRRAELRRLLEGQGFAVQEDARGGRTLRDARAIDAVCLDVCLDADFEGMDLLRRLRLADGDLPVVVVT